MWWHMYAIIMAPQNWLPFIWSTMIYVAEGKYVIVALIAATLWIVAACDAKERKF